ncbi:MULTISPECIES: MarR family winged helix-turn-helix transcriptional regulator [Mammaliicoccus]|uniref:MarR family winged helix-turn-helix transcriptional regulator n=1 Tax=Mammaliicoccus TaxID=2803850 RepID=UPI000D1C2B1E|nr:MULTISPECIES: MarR family transcriptional regulator [Mammaliicoccus]MBW0764900.1 MarR family transcriptional regulator [Mammaliicoccus fleurettii]MEB7805904.1 MarR family transcriptional regulator [Mammaliicoccus fleurettii]PTE34382.1 hypothetical protein BUY94_03825 [Mammaliicoccus fleurettii]
METLDNNEKLQDFKTKLLRVNANFKFLCAHVANENGYSLNFCNLLYVISENEGMTLAELAESVDMDKGNLSRLLNQQIQSGYVEKKIDAIDNRKIRVYITDTGQSKINEISQICITNLDQLLNILPEEELENFMITLNKLDTHFSVLSKNLKD